LTRICLISLGCVSAAMAFGIVANAAIDLVLPAPKQLAVPAKPVEAAPAPATFELAAATAYLCLVKEHDLGDHSGWRCPKTSHGRRQRAAFRVQSAPLC